MNTGFSSGRGDVAAVPEAEAVRLFRAGDRLAFSGSLLAADSLSSGGAGSMSEAEMIARLNLSKAEDRTVDVEPVVQQSEQAADEAGLLKLTEAQLKQIIGSTVAELTQELQATKDSLAKQLAEAEANRDSLQRVFSVVGNQFPAVNTKLAASRDRLSGLAADFVAAADASPTRYWCNPRTGEQVPQRDLSRARDLFYRDRDALRRDMEEYGKKHGLLQGGHVAQDAPTARTDIPPAFLDYLSLLIRETHSARYVYWQFPLYKLELGKGPGDTIQVARFRWLPEATAIADRTLTPGTSLVATSQAIVANAVSIVLGERGLGKAAGSDPVAVPEFIMAYSMLELENAVMTRLGHDYESWEDLSIRSLFFATTRVVYNDNGQVTTDPTTLAAGDDGTMVENFLYNLYAYMSGLQIPAMDDGCYGLVVNDRALAQLQQSLANRNQYLTAVNTAELTSLLQSATNRVQGKASGYAGKYANFHIFSTNAHSMGAAGTEGAQNETIAAATRLTRTSFAFGRAAVARGMGMEAVMRRDTNDDFGRLNRFVWLSHETTSYLDVDPAIAAEQQLRVIEIHTLDQAI